LQAHQKEGPGRTGAKRTHHLEEIDLPLTATCVEI
jgi:hypothetical protein